MDFSKLVELAISFLAGGTIGCIIGIKIEKSKSSVNQKNSIIIKGTQSGRDTKQTR